MAENAPSDVLRTALNNVSQAETSNSTLPLAGNADQLEYHRAQIAENERARVRLSNARTRKIEQINVELDVMRKKFEEFNQALQREIATVSREYDQEKLSLERSIAAHRAAINVLQPQLRTVSA